MKGIPTDKKKELISKIKPRLDFIKSREASSWRADDAAFFLKRLLVRAGHVDADVNWDLPGGNIIELNARPGARYKYGTVSANQTDALSQEELRNYFLYPLVETESVAADSPPYIKEYSQKGTLNVENFLKSQSYWLAKVNLTKETYDRTRKRVNVQLKIDLGIQHKLAPPILKGMPEEDLNQFLPRIQPFVGQLANSSNMSKMNSKLVSYYREKGYHFAKVFVDARHTKGTTTLVFELNRGARYKIDDVIVKGNKKTKSRRIRRYFDGFKDLHFDQNAADKTLTSLLASGAFSSATLTPHPTSGGELDLQVDVVEADAKSVRSYAGFGSFEGFILGLSYTDLNFRGRLLKLNGRGEYSNRGFLGEVSLSEPYFAGEPIQLTLRAFLLQRLLDGYDKTEGGVEASLTTKYLEHHSSRLYLSTSQVSSTSTSLTSAELGPQNYLNTRIGFEQIADFRDNKILPSRGFYAKGIFELGSINGDSATTYQKAIFDSSYRFKLGENNLFFTRFSTGALIAEDSDNLPIDLRLFSGGSDSVRSFEQRHLGPRSLSSDPLGGQAYWNASIEYIRPINDPIKAVIFFDAGQVYSDVSDWGSFSDASYALGIGARINLPIGPVRLEYGYNLNRRSGEPSGTLHFSIGTSF